MRLLSRYVLFCCVALFLCNATPLFAADSVVVEVTGIEGDALKNVQNALVLPYGLVRDGTLDRLWLDRFARQARGKSLHALEPYGYYHAVVTTLVDEPQKGSYRLLIKVVPGEPLRLGQVDVALKGPGAEEKLLSRLAAAFPLVTGGVMLQQNYEQAKNRLMAKAIALGYLDADYSIHEILISGGAASASIKLTLQTGERYHFGDVRIEGAPDYPDTYLQRFIAFKKGDAYSAAKLGETQLNLANSERFAEVVITAEKQQATRFQVPILVKVVSVARRNVRLGVGYGTDTGARFTINYRDMNLFHQGQDLNLKLYVAERLQGFAALYTRPDQADIKSSTAVQLNLQHEVVKTYVSRLASVELDRNHIFDPGELGTAYIKLLQEEFTIADKSAKSRLVLPGVRFSKERFDNPVRPTLGYRYNLDLRGTHQALGSDTALAQVITEGHGVLPLPWRTSLHLRGKAGASLLGDPLGDLPPSIRFFAGGDQSVRGYSYQSLGPRDASGHVVGGKNLLFASIELERALFKDWAVSLFHDSGNAFNDFSTIQLHQGIGVGVHYYTRIGGLNLSLARPLGINSNNYFVHFTVGFQL